MFHIDKNQRGCRSIQENETRKIWEQAPWCRRRTKDIGEFWGCIMQSHDGHPHQRMGWSTISWTLIFPKLVTKILADGTHNKRSTRSVLVQQTQHQHNACGRYHYELCNRIRYWWKLVSYLQPINMQRLQKWQIYVKHQICSWYTISTCQLQCRSDLHHKNWWPTWILKSCLV